MSMEIVLSLGPEARFTVRVDEVPKVGNILMVTEENLVSPPEIPDKLLIVGARLEIISVHETTKKDFRYIVWFNHDSQTLLGN